MRERKCLGILIVFLGLIAFVGSGCSSSSSSSGAGNDNNNPAETSDTASGIYTYSSATDTLIILATSSTFECYGPEAGVEETETVIITSTTMEMLDGDDDSMIWTRTSAGNADDIVGTWEMTGEGDSWELTFESDGSFFLIAEIEECPEDF